MSSRKALRTVPANEKWSLGVSSAAVIISIIALYCVSTAQPRSWCRADLSVCCMDEWRVSYGWGPAFPVPSPQLSLLIIETRGLSSYSKCRAWEQKGEVIVRMTRQKLKTHGCGGWEG